MTTDAQTVANRRNARASTGPKTAKGKEISRRNALRHGLAAKQLVAMGEDEDDFFRHAQDMLAALQPQGAYETALVRRVAVCLWRLDRTCEMEAAFLTAEADAAARRRHRNSEISRAQFLGPPPRDVCPREMALLGRHEAMLDRALQRAMMLLERHRAARHPDARAASPAAILNFAKRTQFSAQNRDSGLPIEVADAQNPAPDDAGQERAGGTEFVGERGVGREFRPAAIGVADAIAQGENREDHEQRHDAAGDADGTARAVGDDFPRREVPADRGPDEQAEQESGDRQGLVGAVHQHIDQRQGQHDDRQDEQRPELAVAFPQIARAEPQHEREQRKDPDRGVLDGGDDFGHEADFKFEARPVTLASPPDRGERDS